MPEGIVGNALRGLGNILRLRGDRFSPAGIELSLPAQPVFDLSAIAAYGGAEGAPLDDGWSAILLAESIAGVGADTVTAAGPNDDVTNFPQGYAFWIYQIGLVFDYVAPDVVGDFVQSRVSIAQRDTFGSGTNSTRDVFLADATSIVDDVPGGTARIFNLMRDVSWPVPWYSDQNLFWRTQKTGAGTSTFGLCIVGRGLPRGVSPLP